VKRAHPFRQRFLRNFGRSGRPAVALAFLPVAVALSFGCSSSSPTTPPVDSGTDGGEDTYEGPPACTAAINKGPWVLAVDDTSAKMRWESCFAAPTSISFAPEAGGAATKLTSTVKETKVTDTIEVAFLRDADFAGTYYMNEVALTKLAPATCYTYTLDADATIKGRFCTARAAGSDFTFAATGDTNPGLGPTVQLIEKVYPSRKPDFTLHGGDLQYYSSGLETYNLWFSRMAGMLRTGAFFPAVGNHESERPNERVDYYDRFYGGAGFDGTNDYYRFSWGGIWFFSINTELDIMPASDQGKWLLAKLQDATTKPGFRFSVLLMHRPFVTCGDSGQLDGQRKAWEADLLKNKVLLVIGAHMHGYERFEMNGITYITAAGGGGLLGKIDEGLARPECTFRKSSGAFFNTVVFDVKPGKIDGVSIDDKGATRDTFSETVP